MTQNLNLECALAYIAKGWRVLPLHSIIEGKCTCGKTDCTSKGKHPYAKFVPTGVKDATNEEAVICAWFDGTIALNIGIATGPESGLVVLDVDAKNNGPETLAQKYGEIPRTPKVGTGGGGFHYYFAYPKDAEVKNSAGTLGTGLDVRGINGYVVCPPSNHISGKDYTWLIDPRAVPLIETPGWLLDGKSPPKQALATDATIPEGARDNTLTAMAGAMRRTGFDEAAIYKALCETNKRCQMPLEDSDLRRISKSISKKTPVVDVSKAIMIHDDSPDTIAEAFEAWSREQGVQHHHHIDTWTVFREGKYKIVTETEIGKWLRRFAKLVHVNKKGTPPLKILPHVIRAVLDALSALDNVWIRPRHAPPVRMDDSLPEVKNIIALNNCLLDITTFPPKQLPLTDKYYNLNYLPFDYDPTATWQKWDKFCGEIFTIKQLAKNQEGFDGDSGEFEETYEDIPDAQSISTLQEIFGLCLTNITSYQKIFGIVGPRRSGKGTIGRLLAEVCGYENISAPTLAGLTTEFGLQGLLNKTVAIVGDANLGSKSGDITRAVERLKSISGEDAQQVNQKNQIVKEVKKLNVRFVILGNELQNLQDPTGALASRFIYLITTQSFLGRENNNLQEELVAERAGIFNWALIGLERLRKRGFFLETDISKETQARAEAIGSPVMAFAHDWCVFKQSESVSRQDLYNAYKLWNEEEGRGKLGRTRFYEEFQRAFPSISLDRVRKTNKTMASRTRVFEGVNLDVEHRTRTF